MRGVLKNIYVLRVIPRSPSDLTFHGRVDHIYIYDVRIYINIRGEIKEQNQGRKINHEEREND